MKVILREDVENLGGVGDIVSVADGYARNFLVPRRLARFADEGQLRHIAHERKLIEDKKRKELKALTELAQQIEAISCTIAAHAGEEDKLFGSVTNAQIAEILAEQGVAVDKKCILLDDPIKTLGVFTVPVKLGHGVEAKLKLWVVKQ